MTTRSKKKQKQTKNLFAVKITAPYQLPKVYEGVEIVRHYDQCVNEVYFVKNFRSAERRLVRSEFLS
jgi:hypothetical protein